MNDALLDALELCAGLPYGFGDDPPADSEEPGGNDFRPVPLWVVEGARELVKQRIGTGAATGKKGPHGGELNEVFSHQKHLVRYLLVRKEVEKGTNIPAASSLVSEALLKSPYHGGEVAISKSYNTVSKALKTKSGALQYYAGWRDLAVIAVNTNNGPHQGYSPDD